MRLLCVWLERLLSDSLAAAQPELAGKALVAVEEQRGAMVVIGVSAQAEKDGVVLGVSLADARAQSRALVARQVDQEQVRTMQERMASLASRYGPWVSEASALPKDRLVVDVTGCGHLFGGEMAMLEDLVRRGQELGMSLRAAIADRLIGAKALAEFSPDETFVAQPSETWNALQPLPVVALGLDERTERAFARLGLRRISDLGSIPVSSLRARFGAQVVRAIDRAKGIAPEPIAMRPHLPPPRLSVELDPPARTPEEVRQHVERLTSALCDRLASQRLGAQRMLLTLAELRAGQLIQRRQLVGAASPMRDPNRWLRLIGEREAVFDPAEGVEKVELRALVAPLDAEQAGLHGSSTGDTLNELIEQLSARLGERRVVRFVEGDSHVPEESWHRASALDSPKLGKSAQGKAIAQRTRRPLTLFERPQAISVKADPRPVKLRWRGETHRISRATGPERIVPPWWRGPDSEAKAARDYWRIETKRGERFWVYQSLQDPGGWYLHGRFA